MADLTEDQRTALVAAAIGAKDRAYAKYSNFPVGAALLSRDGTVFTGCNVENAVYPLTLCAERTAVVKAVSEGHTQFTAIAVVTNSHGFASPCGSCRQVLAEFNPQLPVLLARPDSQYQVVSVAELLPRCFSGTDLVDGQAHS